MIAVRYRRCFLSFLSVTLIAAMASPADGQLFRSLFGDKSKQQQQQQQQQQAPRGARQAAAPPRRGSKSPPRQPAQASLPPQQQPVASPAPSKPVEAATDDERAKFADLIGANWIWSPAHTKDEVPVGDVFFRKTFTLGNVEFGQVHICADNQYELTVNGRRVASGADWRKMDVHDVTELLKSGTNVIAVRVGNTDEGAAGLVARVITKETAGTFESFSSDDTWRTSVKQFADWQRSNFRDAEWLPAEVLGPLGATLPWGDEVVIADEGARFVVDKEFAIERLTTDEQTGSLVAMTFNAEGQILASQEGGPLLLVADDDGDGDFESVTTFADSINTAQGILSMGPRVFAVGSGPEGGALYRLTDQNRDGRADDVQTLLRFRGSPGEHGPHAVRLGPEGLLYVMIGNFARVGLQPGPRSAYRNFYEGDLVTPRYEDPRGHADGVPAPGGTVIRTDTRGSFAELVAGGLRNAYDFAFNSDGEIFTFDADMEWDLGTPWYRPTRINHVPAGAELGWRSGWAKWPSYYLDSLPELIALGGGSPTGVEYYDHFAFPRRLHNALLVGDWGRGLIYAVTLEKNGASYTAKRDVFLKGRPLNVTDMAVGPDGALYFCTGGRGTDGGIYRLRWKGSVPEHVSDLGSGIERALRQPQLDADWARTQVAQVKRELGSRWEGELVQVASDPQAEVAVRRRAVTLLTYFGPAPSNDLLMELSADRQPALRAQAVRLLSMRNNPEFGQQLGRLLADPDAAVRRLTCEAIVHRQEPLDPQQLIELLADSDRFVAFAARRALESMPVAQWQGAVFNTADRRSFLQGATGLLVAAPAPTLARQVLDRAEPLLATNLSQDETLDLLRVVQLALLRGQLQPAEVPQLTRALLQLYPTPHIRVNNELVKLLAYLGPPSAAARFAGQLAADVSEEEKLQIAAYAPRLKSGWQTAEKLALLRYYETVRETDGGYSVSAYIENFARDFFANLTLAERRQVLAAGEHYPTSALSVLAKLPDDTGADMLAEIRALDQRLEHTEGDVYDRLRVGIIATLGRFGDPASRTYLHEVYRTQPERRAPVAMSLTQDPTGENWDLLVDSLRTLEGTAAGDVLAALAQVGRRPEAPDAYRDAILQGLRLRDSGGELAVALLDHWTGQRGTVHGDTTQQLAHYQAWYARQFPDAPPAELPRDTGRSKWSYEELLSFLNSPEGQSGNATRGATVFREATCIKCHTMRGQGERLGPDLTTVASRFQKKEILESIIYPSHVVSDQYASRNVVANGRTYTGIAVRDGQQGVLVLTNTGDKVRLAFDEVEEVTTSAQSAMPEGLLNGLTFEQVADLFAYLMDATTPEVADRGARRR